MLGLKKRWLTVRISTVTWAWPTSPSAVPNPVMLRMIGKGLSYDGTTTLSIQLMWFDESIPEAPPNAVKVERARHDVPWDQIVRIAEQVPELPGDGALQDADLQQR